MTVPRGFVLNICVIVKRCGDDVERRCTVQYVVREERGPSSRWGLGSSPEWKDGPAYLSAD